MNDSSIHEAVRAKLIMHGADRTIDGRLTLNDAVLFSLFVQLERAKRLTSFDAVLEVVTKVETYVALLEKRQLVVFAYMYLHFSELAPCQQGPDETLPNGKIRKSAVFDRPISDEERLIGLWASVKWVGVGERFLRLIYANG
jgi:hypothetical protein